MMTQKFGLRFFTIQRFIFCIFFLYSDSDPSTLTRYILAQQRKHPEATGDLTIILNAIQTACKAITSSVRRAGLQNLYGLHGSTNATGDDVKKLDMISNDIFINTLKHTGRVAVMVSEENEEAIIYRPELEAPTSPRLTGISQNTTTSSTTNNSSISSGGDIDPHFAPKYIAVFDPLDGSSNIDCNVSVGSIFGIYRRKNENLSLIPKAEEAYQPGTALVCAGYAMYGSSTQLVVVFSEDITAKRGVNIFTLDPSIGEFLLSHKHLKIPNNPQRIYSLNEGNSEAFPSYVRKFLHDVKQGNKPYTLRYVGSAVADIHRTLLYGGIFLYPSTKAAPAGKLRLLYELNPMAAIMEAAGGRGITGMPPKEPNGSTRILDIIPTSLHEKGTVILGCTRDVDLLEKYMNDELTASK